MHSQVVGPLLNRAVRPLGTQPKTAAGRQKVQRLKQGTLTRAIGTKNKVDPRTEVNLLSAQVSKTLHPQAFNPSACPRWSGFQGRLVNALVHGNVDSRNTPP